MGSGSGSGSRVCCLMSMVVLFLSLSCSAKWDFKTQSRINHICSQTIDYYLCRNIFNAHLYNNISDFTALTQVALAQTLIYSSDTIVVINRLERNETDQTQRDLFEICKTGYGLLQNQFVDAFFDFAKNNIRSMLFDIQNCERFVTDCEKVLGNKITEMHDKNKHMRVLVEMSNVSGGLIGQDLTI